MARLITFLLLIMIISSCKGKPAEGLSNKTDDPADLHWCMPSDDLRFYVLEQDIMIYEEVIREFEFLPLMNTSFPELIISIARYFEDTPYKAHTLELEGEEQLVINLKQMDCTTFVEYVLAFAFTIQSGNMSLWDFAQILACIRYRDGVIDGYPSRLHYFSEWIHNHSNQGILQLIAEGSEFIPYDIQVGFMTSNPASYRQLSDPDFLATMKEIESKVSAVELVYLPKISIEAAEGVIHDGDIIAFTTNIQGLDVTHTGFAYHQNGRLHLLHASTRSNSVEITPVPLAQYLEPLGRVTGIIVARPVF